MNKTLYAFWKYDLCPYVLGGKVVRFLKKGRVEIEGYQGIVLKPIVILADEEGAAALSELQTLLASYRTEDSKLKDKCRKKAQDIIGHED